MKRNNYSFELKQHFEIYINKYWRNNKKIYLKETYTLMLRDLWFKKLEDIKKNIFNKLN